MRGIIRYLCLWEGWGTGLGRLLGGKFLEIPYHGDANGDAQVFDRCKPETWFFGPLTDENRVIGGTAFWCPYR